VLIECQRLAILSGESLIPLLARQSRVFASIVFLLFIFSFLWLGGWIGGSAYGFRLLTGFPDWSPRAATLFWAAILVIVFLLPVVLGREAVFRYMHRLLTGFAVLTFALCALVVVLEPAILSKAPAFIRACFSFDVRGLANLPPGHRSDLITAIVFMGMGGFACLMYTNLTILARYGMSGAVDADGKYLVEHVTGFRGRPEHLREHGFLAAGNVENERRMMDWLRYMWRETTIGVLGNWLTTFLLALLAFAVLHGTETVPGKEWDLLSAQATFFKPVLGGAAFSLFVLLACSFLLDTWIGFGLLWAQMSSEAVRSISTRAQRISQHAWFKIWTLILVALTFATLSLQPPGNLIRWTAICQMVATPILSGLLVYTNYVYLPSVGPPWYRPKVATLVALVAASLIYMALIAWYLSGL
jgi:Mn2+/Fe2+ NRAMP family transporter